MTTKDPQIAQEDYSTSRFHDAAFLDSFRKQYAKALEAAEGKFVNAPEGRESTHDVVKKIVAGKHITMDEDRKKLLQKTIENSPTHLTFEEQAHLTKIIFG